MSSHADEAAWRWSCSYPDHDHLSWEEADCCDYLVPLLARLQCASGDTALSYSLPLMTGDCRDTTLMFNPDEVYSLIYARLAELYESAGRPEGPGDAGLWRWIAKVCLP
jgi:hypothetical protein